MILVYLTLVAAVWFFAGWIGHRLGILWWTYEFECTRKDRRFFRWFILAGPITVCISLICIAEARSEIRSETRHERNHPSDNDIIYPRRDKT